jgi:hypothetical protein
VLARATLVVMLLALGCGGRSQGEMSATATPAAQDGGNGAPEGPLGVCENRIEYSNEPSDVTTLTARIGYDAAGHIVKYVERSARGYLPQWISRTYDTEGRLRSQTAELPRIPPSHRHATWEYDALGRVVRTTFELGSSPARSTITDVFYDGDGRLLRTQTTDNGVVSTGATLRYLPGDPEIVEAAYDSRADGTVDWTWRYGFSGKWLVSLESVRDGHVQMREKFTYSDLENGELARRDFDTNGDGVADDVDEFSWEGHHIVRSTHTMHDFPADSPQTLDFEWDAAGRLVTRSWKSPSFAWKTTFAWGPQGLERVTRRDVPSGQIIERWAFAYGCPAGYPVAVRIAPMVDWQRELTTMPFWLNRAQFWGFPEAM